ncbi:MAG TPA: hypothetical protein VFK05_33230 [Polyangiaceae bacterium]|nr:hypothetical protein [Polyangiaceae bacterium]
MRPPLDQRLCLRQVGPNQRALARSCGPPYRAEVVEAEGTKIPVQRVVAANDFRTLDPATVVHFVVVSGSEPARQVAAELEGYLIDRAETLSHLSDSERAASDEQAFEFVRQLERLGCVVCAGVDQADLRFDDDPTKTRAWHVGCVAISKREDEASIITV